MFRHWGATRDFFFFQIRGIEAQRTKLGTHCPQWNDKNIKIFITQN